MRSAALAALLAAGCSLSHPPALVPRTDADASDAAPCRATVVRGSFTRIHWFGPPAADERARLDRWCAAVGPVLFRNTPVSPVVGPAELAFVSWNVHVGAGQLERFVADLRSGRAVAGERPQHFVLLLQEAVRSGDVPQTMPRHAAAAAHIGSRSMADVDIDRAAAALNVSIFYVPSMRNGAAQSDPPSDRGNAILSTLPLRDPVAIELPGGGQRRVALAASVAVGAESDEAPFIVSTAHLATRGSPRSLWIFGARARRRTQADALATQLTGNAVVLGADLNSWSGGRDEPAARDLLRVFPSTPDEPVQPTARAGLVLDHLLFRLPPRWRARFVRARDRYGSDHYPVVGWFESAQ
jgi:endonuclease/exonuclease/phosphatase family metal-dependent hydrolase